MRTLLAFGVLIALSASASAETVHHARAHHRVVARPGTVVHLGSFAIPGGPYAAAPYYGSGYGYSYSSIPGYSDPSQFGGQPQ